MLGDIWLNHKITYFVGLENEMSYYLSRILYKFPIAGFCLVFMNGPNRKKSY